MSCPDLSIATGSVSTTAKADKLIDDKFKLALGERFASDYTTRHSLDLKSRKGLIVMTALGYSLCSCYGN